jgi:hypothetical protein
MHWHQVAIVQAFIQELFQSLKFNMVFFNVKIKFEIKMKMGE